MKEIKAYQTSDGKVFTNSVLASEHELYTTMKFKVEKLANDYVAYTEIKKLVRDFIMEHRDELVNILTNKNKRS